MRQDHIRNFCIVAHIDHGKSTLADRLIELTGTLDKRLMREQVLDTMDLERERGITIKLNAVRMNYHARDGGVYELNLIDTPGHVDFTYEVSRSLQACEGAILVVDASQGIQAQTLSNLFLAMDAGLEIIPVLNKIDLPGAEPERRAQELHELIGSKPEEILRISAKEGSNVPELLEAVVRRVPPPRGVADAPLRALIFDSYYDRYRGAIPSIRVVDGTIRPGMKIAFGAHKDDVYEVDEVGYLQLGHKPTEQLEAGEVGYFVANVRGVRDTRSGDTVLDADHRDLPLRPGYRDIMSMVFAGLYPTNAEQFEELRDALGKLQLNDGSLHYEPESSVALGFGFRCGFLGLLHMEIVRERLEREFNLDLISTVPNVEYHVHRTDGTVELVENPSLMPHGSAVDHIEEPYVKARIVAPAEYIGAVMKLGQERRGVYKGMHYVDPTRVEFSWEFPLAEIILDFYDKLKTISRGYASLDYEFLEYRPAELVKLDMLLNGEAVDAFSVIIHRDKAYEWGRKIAEKLKELIPRQLFEVVIQAAIGTKVIARESIRPLRKNVTAKCYGGDVTRKRKHLEKHKDGKRRMKQVGFRDGWPMLYTEGRQRARTDHEIDRLLALAGPAGPTRTGGAMTPATPRLETTREDRRAANEFLDEHGIGEPFAALAPGSIWGSKRWPYYAELAERLAARVAIVVVGGPEDVGLADEVLKAVEGGGGRWRAVNACGRLTLRQSAEVIRRAAVLVTNDSAPLHFAQAVGTPTVAIFGSTVPAFGFGPRGPRDRVVQRDGLSCRPCSAHGPPSCPLGHHF